MDKKDRKDIENVIYLAGCAVNHQTPRIDGMDLDALCRAAQQHMMAGIVGYALASAGVEHRGFQQARAGAIRKAVILDVERQAILEKLENAGIWYMPLKGAVLQDYYPKIGMREMSDNDILIDASRSSDVHVIMEQLGFSTEILHSGHRDDYHKLPVSNFEMHRALFCPPGNEQIIQYYQNIKSKLVKDEGKEFGFHFTHEDFYLYMIAHEYKHFSRGGTGIRSLMDTYVFWKHFDGKLDLIYLQTELEKLGLMEFERDNRELSIALFDHIPLTEKQNEMLSYMVNSGTYGTRSNAVINGVKEKGSKFRYFLSRVFLSMNTIEAQFPWFYYHKVMIPFLPFFRLFTKVDVARQEIRILMSMEEKTRSD